MPAVQRDTEADHVVLTRWSADDVPDGWRQAMLGDVADIVMGHSPPGSTYNEEGVGLPFFQGVRDFNQRHPTPRVFCSKPSRTAEAGDILLSVRAPIGRVNIADRKCAAGRGVAVIRARTPADNRYLESLLRSLESRWDAFESSGSVFGNATRRDLDTLPLLWPNDESERSAIAHILGTLDDKIELNRRQNATLEAMARALFKSWFVDFDPVRAKMEGRDPGLPQHIAALFPDHLTPSNLGDIPETWPLVPLSDLVDVNPSRSLQRGHVAPYLDMKNMPTSGHIPVSVGPRPFGSGMRFVNGDVLVARITPCLENGKTAYVDFLRNNQVGWGSTEYIVLRSRPPLPTEFAYFLARSDRFREFAIQNMSGTSGRQRVSAPAVRQFVLPSPPPELGAEFGRVVGPLLAQAKSAAEESRALANLRDTLLPRLVSGEIRLRDAEELIEAAA